MYIKSQIPNPNIESFNIAYMWKHLIIDIDIDLTYCLDGEDDIDGDFRSISNASTKGASIFLYFDHRNIPNSRTLYCT